MGRAIAAGAQRAGRRRAGAAERSAGELVNDLQAPVAAHHPEIARIVGALRAAGASHAAMSGSGSAVFGLFATPRPPRRAAARPRSAAATRRTRR